MSSKKYGMEFIMDLHECDTRTFTRKSIERYFEKVCNLIHMKRIKLVWWDDFRVPKELRQTEPHLKGISAIQFISTSNITIHTLDLLGNVYLNIFSCKHFYTYKLMKFTEEYFKGKIVKYTDIDRL